MGLNPVLISHLQICSLSFKDQFGINERLPSAHFKIKFTRCSSGDQTSKKSTCTFKPCIHSENNHNVLQFSVPLSVEEKKMKYMEKCNEANLYI